MARPAQRVEMIPIDRITIVNPRLRSKKIFKGIVENIAEIGLKRPITVTSRQGARFFRRKACNCAGAALALWRTE